MSRSRIICFSRADENCAVGFLDKGDTEIVAEFVRELTGAVVKPGLAVRGPQAKNAREKIADWL